MATKPTPGGSDGTYGAELNTFLDESLASDGKIKDGAVFSTSAAPSVDAGVANKKYVDDRGASGKAITAWVSFTGQVSNAGLPTAMGVNGSVGITGVSKISSGKYKITFSTAFADTTYCLVTGSEAIQGTTSTRIIIEKGTKSTTQITVTTVASTTSGLVNFADEVYVMAIGTQ